MKVTALGALVSLIVIPSLIFFVPEEAHAQAAGAGCAALLAARTTGTATGAAAGAGASLASAATGLPVHDLASIATQVAVSTGQGTQDTIKCALDSLAWTVAKVAVQSITRSTVNWINSGFNGSPAFVTDLQQNLNILSDTVANNFFQQLNRATVSTTGFNLRSPFQDQISQQLRANYYKATGSLLGLNQYDLSGHSSNPADFLNDNFSQGGFNAFFSANSNPANNPFGAYEIASNALWTQIDAASQQRKSEYLAGNGFLSSRGNCKTAPSTQSATDTTTGAAAFATAVTNSNTTAQPLAKTEPCFGSPIKTPGSVIESQLENQLGSGVRQLELANSINEVVGALVGQLVNQVLGSGGLSGVSEPTAGGGASYLDQATNPTQYSGATTNVASGMNFIVANDLTTLSAYEANWQKILDAAKAAQQTCGVNQQNSVVVDQATAGVAKATTALQQETAISKSMQAATETSASTPTQLTTVYAQYQSYLGAPTTPSATDEAYAAAQSGDTSGSTGSTPSLYTQMVNAKTSCPTQT